MRGARGPAAKPGTEPRRPVLRHSTVQPVRDVQLSVSFPISTLGGGDAAPAARGMEVDEGSSSDSSESPLCLPFAVCTLLVGAQKLRSSANNVNCRSDVPPA